MPIRDRAGAGHRGGDALRALANGRGGRRAVQRGDGVRADLDARGLLPAGAGVDGDGRRGGVHRRARQPRLLRGRRELPDAGARRGVGERGARAAARRSAAARAARAGRDRDRGRVRVGAAHRRAGGVPGRRGAAEPAGPVAVGGAAQRGAPRVRAGFAQELRCPACRRDHTLVLDARESDAHEVREGTLRCGACGNEFVVRRGVMELLHDPPSYIVAEAAGLERFAAQMRAEGWDRELVRRLPDIEHGYWYVQARSMHQLVTMIPFKPGQSILDVGSNTCWAANRFAELGLQAIALDIATTELQGLYTAEYFIDDGHTFFERVLGSMDAIPLASSSLDYVYCCEVLHHNDPASLRRTFAEIFRVLRPGGRLLMVNETLKTLHDPNGVHVEGVEQYEGYEHAHWAARYRWEATRAGFLTEVAEPHYRPFFGDVTPSLRGSHAPLIGPLVRKVTRRLHSNPVVRRGYLSWLNHVQGTVSMNMLATKPLRYVGMHEQMGAPQRMLRLLAASIRLSSDRRAGRAPARLPRTPEQAAAVNRH